MEIKIEGMSCQHCVQSVLKAVSALPGVDKVEVSLEKKNAVISGSPDRAAVVKAIEDIGFSAN